MISSGSTIVTSTTSLPVKLYSGSRGVNATVVVNGQVIDTSTNSVIAPQVGLVIGDSSIQYGTANGIVGSGVQVGTPYTVSNFTGDLWVYPEWNFVGAAGANQEVHITYTTFDTK